MRIEVRNLCKRFDEHEALRDVGFSVESGQLLVVLGPSGCGKSTLLRLLAGLDRPDSGGILFGGRNVTALPPAQRGFSMVFQSYALFPHLSVRENIVFGLRTRKRGREVIQERLDKAIGLLGLDGLLSRKPGELSGGQRQRVALGRAIVSEKPICFMDEPLSNLDAKLREAMRREIRKLQQDLGITMIYVTHDQTEAMTMADSILLLKDGATVQHDAPADLYERPASVFAARFIGTPPMNLFTNAQNAALLTGVRPENVRLAKRGLPAQVQKTEYLGADTLVSCAIRGGEEVCVRCQGKHFLAPGQEVCLSWEPEHQHLFDRASGRNAQPSIQEAWAQRGAA
ncbi:ABC transporter ATP-binding protein [Desulfocurvus sp. DL9XJH121]